MNCSQIFCTFAVETTVKGRDGFYCGLWIALKFFVLLQSKQLLPLLIWPCSVVNCSQIFCTFAVETTPYVNILPTYWLWIALKFFVLLQSKQQNEANALGMLCCELLSNFLYFCSRNNQLRLLNLLGSVVNCSQIFCTFAVETTPQGTSKSPLMLWIALKFFVLLQSKQQNKAW